MNLKRVRSLMVCVLPLSLPLFAACTAPTDGTAPDEENLGRSAQAVVSAISISAGEQSSFVARSDGLWAFGDNTYGQLGNTSAGAGSSIPVEVLGQNGAGTLTGVTAVAGGKKRGFALKSDHTVWAWGDNTWGALGIGNTTDQTTPQPVSISLPSGVTITAVAGSPLALASDHTVWTWGFNGEGQLGSGTPGGYRTTPGQVTALSGVTAVAGGSGHSLALVGSTVWAWGKNGHGQLGYGGTTDSSTPTAISALSGVDVTAVAAGATGSSSFAVASDHTVWAWGGNANGQLGNNTHTDQHAPVQVWVAANVPLTDVTAVAVGSNFALALKSDHTVWAWGSNASGQLGDGTNATDRIMAVQVHGRNDSGYLTGVTAIAAGGTFALAQKSDGSVWAWGNNGDGQLGDGTTTQRHTPVPTPSDATECDDGNPCTTGDVYTNGVCAGTAVTDGTPCTGDVCTVNDTCQAGVCTMGSDECVDALIVCYDAADAALDTCLAPCHSQACVASCLTTFNAALGQCDAEYDTCEAGCGGS
jgi:alpha-tubulin suppressor-like RCC1 family protein